MANALLALRDALQLGSIVSVVSDTHTVKKLQLTHIKS